MKTITKEITLFKLAELPEDIQEEIISTFRQNDDYAWNTENADTLKAFEQIFPVKVRSYEYGYRNDIDFITSVPDPILALRGPRLSKYIYNNFYPSLVKGKYYSKPRSKGTGYVSYHSKCQTSFGDCPLTGYGMDNDILDPIFAFLKTPSPDTDLADLMRDCLYAWLYACRDDYEYWMSEPSIREDIEANDYDFTEDGSIY